MAYGVCLREEEEGDGDLVRMIPLDLLIEILIRLPAKSLMRFKCVSKPWSSLIRSKYLTNRYLTDLTVGAPQQQPRLYIRFINNPRCESVLLPLSSSLSSDGSMSFDQDLTMPCLEGCIMVVLRGFILYTNLGKAFIYNPTTRQFVALPSVNTSNIVINEFFYFLGYDPVLDQYKVVCNVVIHSSEHDETKMTSEHYVFVLEARGFWKKIEFDQQPHHRPTNRGTGRGMCINGVSGMCINGVIYYLVSTDYYSYCGSVVSFDVRSEVFNMIQAPDVVSKHGECVDLIEYGGKPAIFDYTDFGGSGLMDLWVLEDVGKWSRKSLDLQPGQMHLVVNDLTVEGTTQTGEVILSLTPSSSPYYIFYYDLQKKDLRKVQIRGIDHIFGGISYFYSTLMEMRENIMYLEI